MSLATGYPVNKMNKQAQPTEFMYCPDYIKPLTPTKMVRVVNKFIITQSSDKQANSAENNMASTAISKSH